MKLRAQHDAYLADPAKYLASLVPEKTSRRERRRTGGTLGSGSRGKSEGGRGSGSATAATAAAAALEAVKTEQRRARHALAVGFAAGLRVGGRTFDIGETGTLRFLPSSAQWRTSAAALDATLTPAQSVDVLLASLFPHAPQTSSKGTPQGEDGEDVGNAGDGDRFHISTLSGLDDACARLSELELVVQKLNARGVSSAGDLEAIAARHSAEHAVTKDALMELQIAHRAEVRLRNDAEAEHAVVRAKHATAMGKVEEHGRVEARLAIAEQCSAQLRRDLAAEKKLRSHLEQRDVKHNDDLELKLSWSNTACRKAELACISLQRGVNELSNALADERAFAGQLTLRVEELVGQIGTYQEGLHRHKKGDDDEKHSRDFQNQLEGGTRTDDASSSGGVLVDESPYHRVAAESRGAVDAGRSPSREIHAIGATRRNPFSSLDREVRDFLSSNSYVYRVYSITHEFLTLINIMLFRPRFAKCKRG